MSKEQDSHTHEQVKGFCLNQAGAYSLTDSLSGIIGYTAVCIASPLAWFGAVALLIPVYYRMMMKPVKTV